MREMGWTFRELQETPVYVRRFCTDCMVIRRQAEARRANRRG